MNPVLTAVIVLAAIGLLAAVLLALASKFMAVPVDEKFPVIRECLPGANCGGCGYPGCDGYAQALTDGTETSIMKCVAGGQAVVDKLSQATGQEAGQAVPKVAFVHCRGNCDATKKKDNYVGSYSCKSAKLLFGGDGSCIFGCLGYGDCTTVCPEGGIMIVNGVARINQSKCLGCGTCVSVCPNHVISVVPKAALTHVACSSKEKGAAVRKKCTAGCIGCGLCMKNCEHDAIKVENNLAVIDYDKCVNCGKCSTVCPSKCII